MQYPVGSLHACIYSQNHGNHRFSRLLFQLSILRSLAETLIIYQTPNNPSEWNFNDMQIKGIDKENKKEQVAKS